MPLFDGRRWLFLPGLRHKLPVPGLRPNDRNGTKTIAGIGAIAQAVRELHDADTAANFEQQLLEDQVENLITAFQRGVEALFDRLPNAATFKRDANLFQRLGDGSALWQLATGTGYQDLLSAPEGECLQIMIHRRHKIGHCQGIVDAKYVQQSGDQSYAVGQRLVTAEHHVLQLADVLEKLVAGLKAVVGSHGGVL
jgi:hypothetical protein